MPRLKRADWEADSSLAPVVAKILQHRPYLGELYPMLLNSPPIAEALLEFGTAVRQKATLDGKIRELAICRVGLLLKARYEVYRHEEIALEQGVSREKLDALGAWQTSSAFDAREHAALAYAEAITTDVTVEESTFDALRAFFSEREILELTVTVAYYNMICRILVALQIEAPHPVRSH